MQLSGNAMPKKKLIPVTASDAQKKITAKVASPYGHGIDRVKKVEDTIDNMHRRGHLSDTQYGAACQYRNAFDIVFGSMGQTLNTDRVRGGGNPTLGPGDVALQAAEVLNRADRKLGEIDAALVEMAVGRGYSIEQCAARINGRNPTLPIPRELRLHTGKKLRDALDVLSGRHPKIERVRDFTSFRSDKIVPTEPGIIDRGKVAHAGHGKVEWTE